MDKSLNKNVFKLLFCFVMFFSFTIGVSAKTSFTKLDSNDIFANCNKNNQCAPLCIYSDSSGNSQALIGYHYGTKEWEVSYNKQITGDNKDFSGMYYKINSFLPDIDIYDGAKEGSWSGGIRYSKLVELYRCPTILYVNVVDDYLCFEDTGSDSSNTEGECFNRGLGYIDTNSMLKMTIKYQFVNEYTDVATNTYKDLAFIQDDEGEVKNKQKIEFLHSIDQGIKYDSSKSAKDNSLDNCSYIKENVEGSKMNDYLKKVAPSRENYITKYIDPSFASNAQKFKSRSFTNFNDFSFYKYNVLYGMMVKNNDSSGNSDNMEFKRVAVMQAAHSVNDQTQNKPAFKYIYDLYGNNVSASVNYIVSVCGDSGIVIDAPSMSETLDEAKKELGLYVYQDPQISFKDEYDCSFLTDVAGIIGDAYFILEMAGLAILVVLSVMDYLKVFLSDNADELKKANSRFIKRLIVAVLLFLLPALVNFSLRIFKIEGINSDHPLCVQISNK